MDENIFEKAIETVLPYVISILEIMGIAVVTWSAISAFYEFLIGIAKHKGINFIFAFSQGLAAGLEFKMAAEILKTVLIREISELLILGAVILLRAILSVLIHFEMKYHK